MTSSLHSFFAEIVLHFCQYYYDFMMMHSTTTTIWDAYFARIGSWNEHTSFQFYSYFSIVSQIISGSSLQSSYKIKAKLNEYNAIYNFHKKLHSFFLHFCRPLFAVIFLDIWINTGSTLYEIGIGREQINCIAAINPYGSIFRLGEKIWLLTSTRVKNQHNLDFRGCV